MTSFTAESWIWYGFVIPVVLLRLTSKYFQRRRNEPMLFVEDWLMVFSAIVYTALTICFTVTVNAPNNYVTAAEVATFSQNEIRARERGGKLNMVCEILQNTLEWTVKGCLLLLYTRVFKAFGTHIFIIITAVYVVVSYIIQEALYFGYWCRPFTGYWAVPPPSDQCPFPVHHMILNAVLNVTSDLMILMIPIPLLWGDALPWRRKLLLVIPLSMGVFTIFAAVICKVESLYLQETIWWGLWCIREAAMVMIAANMPYVWGLLRRFFKGQDTPDRSGKGTGSESDSRRTSKATILEKKPWKVLARSISSLTSASEKTSTRFSQSTTITKMSSSDMEASVLFTETTWSIDNSSTQHIRKPSVAAIAVDKLYRLDSREVEFQGTHIHQIHSRSTTISPRRYSQASTRRQSIAAIAVDKLYRVDDIGDDSDDDKEHDTTQEGHEIVPGTILPV